VASQVGLDRIEIVADGLDHPEGVASGPDGMLYAGGEAGQIYRVDPESGEILELASSGGWILGLAIDADGEIVCCDAKRHEVLCCSPEGALRTLSAGSPDRAMVNPNFAVLHDDAIYVSASGTWGRDDGCIYRIDSDGRTAVWTDSLTAFPNGMALNEAGDALYVVLSTIPSVWRLPIAADGSPGQPEVVVELPGTVPDGLAFDAQGGLYISCYRPDRICRLAPGGELEVVAEDFQGTLVGAPTNVAFGGNDGRSLFIASLARWHIGRMLVDVPGLPLRRPHISAWRVFNA
jgi:sugar lactone lactonase YvrE